MKNPMRALLDELSPGNQCPKRIAASTGGRTVLVSVEEVLWLQAADNYVRLHLESRSVLLRGTFSNLTGRLDPEFFLRVHRSHAVNLTQVQEWQSSQRGDASLRLKSGLESPVSRN
jgi:two-component system LytT family response regulator